MEVSFGKAEGLGAAPKAEPTEPKTIEVQAEVVKTETPVAGVAVESVNTAAAPAPLAVVPVAPLPVASSNGLILGDTLPDFGDIVFPRLNIVQNIGGLKDTYQSGCIVFGQQDMSAPIFVPPVIDPKTKVLKEPASAPVHLYVLGFRPTRYVEKTIGGAKGLIVKTEEEVVANGGTLDYNEHKLKMKDGMKLFQPLAEAVILIERPTICADDDTIFVYEIEKAKYALGLWAMKGTSYTNAAKRVLFTNRRLGYLRNGYPTRGFSLVTREDDFTGTNKAWVPVMVPDGAPTAPAVIEFIRGVLTQS